MISERIGLTRRIGKKRRLRDITAPLYQKSIAAFNNTLEHILLVSDPLCRPVRPGEASADRRINER